MENAKIENSLKVIEDLLKTEKAEEAKNRFEELEEQNTVRYFLLKGKIEQKYQNWGKAINAFNRVLDIDPANTEAANNLHLIKNILNFWNPDLLNP
ncbi:tetratricopeptide repeat protein [Draconibacterium sediminis]|uniref:Uncharacterized protein n=1 Tax=Draconibacterium sediminis TaxID=1544798 RepID=A0A0D8J3Y9_9BACT|nr:hypothetical protein [Draconibacterium sediminis]KJF41690.1 hypothetical protein LH29_24090 [Draconibacterium sediminis]